MEVGRGGEDRPTELRLRPRDPLYPPLLETLPDAPDPLYVRGDPRLLAGPAVAVVGTRHPTSLGFTMGQRLGARLAAAGVVVVSGCAIGVDAAAHRGALQVGGRTVAVLGGGLDVAAPPSNRELVRDIGRLGCLAGEHPPGMPPLKHHFPLRNRIIAGLCRVVVVVEAPIHSGALITARLALAAGREVMAVPGHPLNSSFAGSNRLIADGARPVLAAEDVLQELGELPLLSDEREPATGIPASRPRPSLDEEAVRRRLVPVLTEDPVTVEALAESVRAPVGVVLAAMTRLEILGVAKAHPGGRYGLLVEPRRKAEERGHAGKRAGPEKPGK